MKTLKECQKRKAIEQRRLNGAQVKRLIHRAMNQLSYDDFLVIYELYFNHTSIHQLAKKLGVSRATVRRRRGKAIKSLKEIISRNK